VTWLENAKTFYKEEGEFMERECQDTQEMVIDHLCLELDTIRDIRDQLRSLKPESRKRVWFFVDDLIKQGIGE